LGNYFVINFIFSVILGKLQLAAIHLLWQSSQQMFRGQICADSSQLLLITNLKLNRARNLCAWKTNLEGEMVNEFLCAESSTI